MQYRYEIEHAPANLALQGEGPEKLKEHAPMQYSIKSGHAPANFAFVAVLTSSFALLAFSKYWRAQIAPCTDPYASVASIN